MGNDAEISLNIEKFIKNPKNGFKPKEETTVKKIFVAICSVLPGGFILLGAMLLFAGCAHFQYQTNGNNWIEGITASPETVMMADAEAEAIRAQAYATRQCSNDPKHCGAVWGPWGAYSMDTPAGYTWAGIRAVGGGGSDSQSSDVRRDLADIKKSVRAVSKWQDTFTKTLKNRKKGN